MSISKNIFTMLISSLILANTTGYSEVIDLSQWEKKVYSQNGEDGVIEKIFEAIGTTSKYFVEFGVENGTECNTRYLVEAKNWQGLMMDGGYENPAINLRQTYITAENIKGLFRQFNVPSEFDLLSIDIDSNDFYVWNSLAQEYSPRVVVIEYNATHLPHEDKVVLYDPNLHWDGSNYYGASILALYRLGQKLGYSLVYAENRGVNLFFIRNDILKESNLEFLNINDVEKIYKYPRFGSGPNGGHRIDQDYRCYVNSSVVDY